MRSARPWVAAVAAVAFFALLGSLLPSAAHAQGLVEVAGQLSAARAESRVALLDTLTQRDQTLAAEAAERAAAEAAEVARLAERRAGEAVEVARQRLRDAALAAYMGNESTSATGALLLGADAYLEGVTQVHYAGVVLTHARTQLADAEQVHREAIADAQAANGAADAARSELAAQRQREQVAQSRFDGALVRVGNLTTTNDRLLASMWGDRPGNWRCDAGGLLAGDDGIYGQLARRQAGQQVAASRAASLLPPLERAIFTSPFGWRGNPFGGGGQEWHQGVDLAAATGTPIRAVDAGEVIVAGDSGDGYGNKVVIDHAGGLGSVYAHLNDVSVNVGQRVERGQTIGGVGSTGRSTGSHLHYELRAVGAQCDPMWGWGAG